MRAVNQSIGRAIRHIKDYAVIILMDKRYAQTRIRNKLPGWIRNAGITDPPSFGQALQLTRTFFQNKNEVI